MRPSRFAVVSFLVLLLIGTTLSLCIMFFGHRIDAHWIPYTYPVESYIDEDRVEQYSWPSVPGEVTSLGEPNNWTIRRNLFYRVYAFELGQRDPYEENVYSLEEYHFGRPLSARVVKFVSGSLLGDPNEGGQVWPPPPKGEQFGSVEVKYKPLGLILNPIIYALPIWLIVMGLRWVFVTRRSRKRARLGVCVGCSYELAGLGVCPECGRSRV